MKRLTAIFLITVLLCGTFAISAFGADEEKTTLRDQLINQDIKLVEEFLDEERFDDSMGGIIWEDQPLLFSFAGRLFSCTEMTYDEIIEYAFRNWGPNLVILHDKPIGISRYKYQTKIGAYDFPVFTHIQDILDGTATQEFLGQSCTINNVHCFGVAGENDEKDVLYVTDKGMYVRCYANGSAEAVEFDWDSYCEIAKVYYDYITSPELNFNENGQILAGRNPTFLEFVENPTKYVPDYGKEPESPWLVWCIAGAGVFVVGVVVAAIFLLRRRKKHQATEE